MDTKSISETEKKKTPVKPLVASPTKPQKNAIGPSIPIENLQSIGFEALAKRSPVTIKDFEKDTGDRFPNRGSADGKFYVQSNGGGSSAWNAMRYDNGIVEVEGRLSGDDAAAWILCLTGDSELNPGIQITVGGDGSIVCSSSMFDKHARKMKQIKLQRINSRKTRDFHTVVLLLSDKSVEVFFDGETIGRKITLDFDITPGVVALGGRGKGRAEFERLRFWKADD